MTDETILILKYTGNRFRYFRKERGISRKTAAEMIGITPRTLASYERGEREITVDKVAKMAEVYKTTFTNLTDYKNVLNTIRA